MPSILEVQHLRVAYSWPNRVPSPALVDVNFSVNSGEILGVLGESGSGKSTLAASLLRLLPVNGKIQQGKILFEGSDILQMASQELQKIRGARISLIFQEPSLALHPTIRVRDQVREVLAAHESSGTKALRQKTNRVLAAVFPDESERIASSYPHQLSGGQRQRVLIAQAIACGPSLVIADEPTASLDAQTEREILSSFQRLRQDLGLAMILITHNPSLLLDFADRVLVLYAGRVAELGPARDVLTDPQHPYTRALLRCLPHRAQQGHGGSKTKLPVIPGDGLHAAEIALGCTFAPRCPDRMASCETNDPQEIALSNAHNVSCFKFGGLPPFTTEGGAKTCSRS